MDSERPIHAWAPFATIVAVAGLFAALALWAAQEGRGAAAERPEAASQPHADTPAKQNGRDAAARIL